MVNYKLALHWPHLKKLELHLPSGETQELYGVGIALFLDKLRQNAVPVLSMYNQQSWHHMGNTEADYDLNSRMN